MHALIPVALAVALSTSVPVPGFNKEQCWVAAVAVHFLDAAISENFEEAIGLATETFTQRLRVRAKRVDSAGEVKGLEDVFWPTHCAVAPYGQPKGVRAVVKNGQFSPAGDEGVLRGFIVVQKEGEAKTKARFTVMVSKSTAGKWQVSGVTLVVEE